MAKLAVLGTSYVGLITGVAFAEWGHDVTCVDIIESKVSVLNEGKAPIHEEGLDELLRKHVPGSLRGTTDLAEAMEGAEFIFIAVQTPEGEDGAIDLSFVRKASEDIAGHLKSGQTVVVKSTVVPGTTSDVVIPALEGSGLGKEEYNVAVNPEFLREGIAVHDALEPSRIVIGATDGETARAVADLYDVESKFMFTDPTTAEAVKYASNAILAVKISFANEVATLCEDLGIDVYDVMDGVGLDPRISRKFLNAGMGFGGSCLPKDTKAFERLFVDRGLYPGLLEAVHEVNDTIPVHVVKRLSSMIGDLNGKRVAVLGLAFKEGTDDVRQSRARPLVRELLERGCVVVAHDPIASGNFKRFGLEIEYADSISDALEGADAAIIQTAWEEYSGLDVDDFVRMAGRTVIDGRRILSAAAIDRLSSEGFSVYLLGRGPIP